MIQNESNIWKDKEQPYDSVCDTEILSEMVDRAHPEITVV